MGILELVNQIQLARMSGGTQPCMHMCFLGSAGTGKTTVARILGKLLKEKGYEIASYSGYTFEQLLSGTAAQRALLEQLDVLIDGPFILAERSLETPFRGSKNQRVLDVPKSLAAGEAVWVTAQRWLGEY